MGDDALALVASVEAEAEAEADEGEGPHGEQGTGEEDALRTQMQADLADLGFSTDEIAEYLESLALDAELEGVSADPEGP